MNMRPLQQMSYLTLIYLFFYIPIIILIVYSFNDSQYSLLWHGFTWRWYAELFSDSDLWISTWHSFLLGLSSASVATLIGMIAAVSLYRYRFMGRNFLNGLVFILILSPEIVTGASLLILFTFLRLELGFTSLLLAHISFCIPFVIVTAYSRLISFDKNIFEAAKDLGANDLLILRSIILPLLWPALFAGWLLSFTLSLDDVIISYFVAGPEFQILPLQIFSMVRSGIKPEINALCSVLFCVTLTFIVLSQLALRKKA
ncbi:Inner membrane ABC transporter permease protein YdcV [Aquicella siphonis]|uniref:Spermidine/putrescine transport system permease protein PotC n=1 Tax=Aquicella siphonis TaxID=254247 RepID=A0A5E4PI23_9COXI|nr:Inner membrane ABC transporter permease protein YdcV [Aquicella siphonis]